MPQTHQGLVEDPHSAGAPESLGIAPELEFEAHIHESAHTALHCGNLTDFVTLVVTDRAVHVFRVWGLEPFQGLGHLGGLRGENLLLFGGAAEDEDEDIEEGRGERDVLQHGRKPFRQSDESGTQTGETSLGGHSGDTYSTL